MVGSSGFRVQGLGLCKLLFADFFGAQLCMDTRAQEGSFGLLCGGQGSGLDSSMASSPAVEQASCMVLGHGRLLSRQCCKAG